MSPSSGARSWSPPSASGGRRPDPVSAGPAPTQRAALLADPVDGARLEHRRLASLADVPPAHASHLYGPFVAHSLDDVWTAKRLVQHARRHRLPAPAPHLAPRQNSSENTCWVGNAVLSCYPTAGTEVAQDQWGKFIWNNNFPGFIQVGAVDIYLFRDDGDKVQTSWTSVNNHLGRISFSPKDDWWQDLPQAATIQPGQNVSWPFYFVVTAAGAGTASGMTRQSTWTAVQTALPTSIALARASSSSASLASASAASSRSLASATSSAGDASLWSATHTLSGASLSSYLSSLGAAETSSVVSQLSTSIETSLRSQGFTGTQTGLATLTTTLPDGHIITATATAQANGGSLNGNAHASSHTLPRYAIALITVFGSLALLLALAGAYLVWRRWLRRTDPKVAAAAPQEKGASTHSTSPMLAPVVIPHSRSQGGSTVSSPRSPLSGVWVQEASPTCPEMVTTPTRPMRSLTAITANTAETVSHTSLAPPLPAHEETSWSDEASRMADAFRNALRQPSFAALGDSVSNKSSPAQGTTGSLPPGPAGLGFGLPASSLSEQASQRESVVRTVLPLPLPSGSGSGTPTAETDPPSLSQILQQELARDGVELHPVQSGAKRTA